MPSTSLGQFTELLGWVQQLIDIHGRLQTGRGRRHQQEAIHRAGVVMVVAVWESYVEGVMLNTLDVIETAPAPGPGTPPAVAAPTWARALLGLSRAEINKDVRKFHTPNAENVQTIMRDSFGFDPHASWHWRAGRRNWNQQEMKTRLNHWVRVRHCIAHGSSLPTDIVWLRDTAGRARLTLTLLRECKSFFEHVADQTDEGLAVFLRDSYGIPRPW